MHAAISTLLVAEVANALWKAIRRGELAADGAADRLESLGRILELRSETELMPRALEIAVELQHPVYDCVYLAMAEEVGTELLTADQRLLQALDGSPYTGLARDLAS